MGPEEDWQSGNAAGCYPVDRNRSVGSNPTSSALRVSPNGHGILLRTRNNVGSIPATRTMRQETKDKIRKSCLGKKYPNRKSVVTSQKTKDKISAALKGRKNSRVHPRLLLTRLKRVC